MKKSVGFKFAASTLVLGLTMVGCKPSGYRPSVNSAKAATADAGAAKAYTKAQEAVQQGSVAQALEFAERAVEYAPRDAGYRMLLADLYLKNGRFVSAEQAFTDVRTLDPGNRRAGLSRVLAMIGQGKSGEASMELDRLASSATPADVGLAYALAGQPQRAVEMLEPAARAPGATGRVRQNLALALRACRRLAEGPPRRGAGPFAVRSRRAARTMGELANPSAPHSQSRACLAVTPTADAGQPVRLALASPVPVAYAAAEEPRQWPAPARSEPSALARRRSSAPVAGASLQCQSRSSGVAQLILSRSAAAPVVVCRSCRRSRCPAAPEPVRETFAYRAPQPVESFAQGSRRAGKLDQRSFRFEEARKRMVVEEVAAALEPLVKTPRYARFRTIASAPLPLQARKRRPGISSRALAAAMWSSSAPSRRRLRSNAPGRRRSAATAWNAEPLTTTVSIAGKGHLPPARGFGFCNPLDANRPLPDHPSGAAHASSGNRWRCAGQWASRYAGRRA
jgi:tetratricopeptide (TPR) repeat protein